MFKKFTTSFLALIILFAVSPFTVFAQGSTTAQCQELIKKFKEAQVGAELVGQSVVQTLPRYCTEGEIFDKITNYIYVSVGVIAVIFFIYGGYLYIVSGASETSKKKGKEVLLYTTAGVIVVITAVTLVNIVAKFITGIN